MKRALRRGGEGHFDLYFPCMPLHGGNDDVREHKLLKQVHPQLEHSSY